MASEDLEHSNLRRQLTFAREKTARLHREVKGWQFGFYGLLLGTVLAMLGVQRWIVYAVFFGVLLVLGYLGTRWEDEQSVGKAIVTVGRMAIELAVLGLLVGMLSSRLGL